MSEILTSFMRKTIMFVKFLNKIKRIMICVIRVLCNLVSFPVACYERKLHVKTVDTNIDEEVKMIGRRIVIPLAFLNRISIFSSTTTDKSYFFSNKGYIIEICESGTHKNDHHFLISKICCEKNIYFYVPRRRNDKVLRKYNINFGMEGYILKLFEGDIIDIYGIDLCGHIHHYSEKDFKKDVNIEHLAILQAPCVALYGPGYYAKGLRELDQLCDYMVSSIMKKEGSFLEEFPNYDLKINCYWTSSYNEGRSVEFLLFALHKYDIFHFHSNRSLMYRSKLFETNSDMPYIKQMGKMIVHSAWGYCDVRKKDDPTGGVITECDVCNSLKKVFCLNIEYNKIIQRTNKCADVHLCGGRVVRQYKGTYWIDNPISIDRYEFNYIPPKYRVKENGKIKIYHSFGNARVREDVKGTRCIIEAVSRLANEGYNVELMYFDSVPHSEIRYYQAQADIVIEQLYAGWHGSTGVECMALGKIVVAYMEPADLLYAKEVLNRDVPIVSATVDTIYDVIKDIITHPERYEEYKQKSKEYVKNIHDYRVVTKKLLDIYKENYSIRY